MSIVERIKQGGSTITYIIVGLVLFVGLIGLVCFVKQRGEIARQNQATIAYEEQQKASQNAENSNKTGSTKSEPIEITDDKALDNNDTLSVSDNSDSDLPQTGPEDVFLNASIVFVITLSIASYLLSRRVASCL